MKRISFVAILFAVLLQYPSTTSAQQEIGHFAPGSLSIRDFTVPDSSGFYGVVYNYFYFSNRVNNAEGDQINSIMIKSTPIDLEVKLSAYALAPTFIWVSKFKFLRAKYAAYVSFGLGNTSVGAMLARKTKSGRSTEEAQFGVADLFVQPLWLGWSKKHWDFALGYGFYAPIGKYETETTTLYIGETVTVEAADNIGLGFWTNQIQGAASLYPWVDKRMSIAAALTYEIHSNKRDFDLKPGQNLTLSWGVSEYLALTKNQLWVLELGPAGYNSWQVTDDKGADAANPATKDAVHAIGGQLGIIQASWNASLNFHYFYEFAARDRFQGSSIGLNFAVKI